MRAQPVGMPRRCAQPLRRTPTEARGHAVIVVRLLQQASAGEGPVEALSQRVLADLVQLGGELGA